MGTYNAWVKVRQGVDTNIPTVIDDFVLQQGRSSDDSIISINIGVVETNTTRLAAFRSCAFIECLRSSHANSLDTESHELEHIRTGTDAAVGNDSHLLENLGRVAVDLIGHLKWRVGMLKLATTVVREIDTVKAMFNGL